MLQEATLELTQAAFQQGSDADKRLLVIFTEEATQDVKASAEQGRPIFKPCDYVMIMVPGDKDSIVHRPARQMDYDRFPKQFAAYKNKQKQETSAGTPLAAVPWLTKSQVRELEYFHCHTVEQLAALPDSNAQNFMGIVTLKQQAQAFLEAARGAAPLTAMQKELESRDEQIASLQKALTEQGEMIKKLQKDK